MTFKRDPGLMAYRARAVNGRPVPVQLDPTAVHRRLRVGCVTRITVDQGLLDARDPASSSLVIHLDDGGLPVAINDLDAITRPA